MIGESVGAYTILSELGRGGMGVVYLAQHRHLRWKAAIKILMREFSERPDLLARFFTEARAASLIDHEGIVRVLDCDVHSSGHAYIVMEHLEGQTVGQYLAARERIPFPEAAAIILRVADALSAAHDKGIVHRDLKPDNIFLLAGGSGAVKIVDFGIAKLSRPETAPTRTLSGMLLGTPLYMSPEQARGATTLDARADVYSLGCMLFEMLTGRPPFIYSGAGELIAAHLAQAPPPLESLESSLPGPLRVLVERMLAKAPAERPALRAEVIPTLQPLASARRFTPDTLAAGGAAFAVATPRTPRPPPGIPIADEPPPGGWITPGQGQPTGEVPAYSAPPPTRSRAGPLTILALTAAAVGALALWRYWPDRSAAPLPEPTPTTTTTAPPPPAPPRAAAAEPPAPTPAAERPPPPSPAPIKGRTTTRASAPGRSSASLPSRPPRAIRLRITSDPPGASICLANDASRLGMTNGTLQLKSEPGPLTLLLYHPGYHIARVQVAGDENADRSVRLRPLGDDDLQPPPPCR